ncbi:MAG: site-specific DNA-methyltransferase [Akkermansia sp.]|nr:site-specific DNA-methyltransferase [Akkermansia sp.]
MNNRELFRELEQLLRRTPGFCTNEGVLIRNSIAAAAMELRPELLRLLLGHNELRNYFFTVVEGVQVFDKMKFLRFVANKNFLPDSYTAYRNSIGLADGTGDMLAERRQVVLSWPYKDCLLEGGQTREEARRQEIFWNETLAPDEINRLTEPKALCNFHRVTAQGVQPANELCENDNYIIRGNNLLALYSLRKRYAGQVKMIYIDPPYNTGGDSFGYNDTFNHSTWLTFMRNRLEIARELLTPDGSIYVQLDWNEAHYCKVLMDEIFGRDCFRNEIIWCYTGPGSPGMKQLNRKHDTILWYSRNPNEWIFNGNDIRLRSEVHAGGFKGEMSANVSSSYSEKGKIPEDWWELFHTPEDLADEIRRLSDEQKKINDADWFKAAVAARIKVDGVQRTGYMTEKPYKLMERLIRQGTNEGDLVLDFFAGSGTTGYVASYLNRRYILVEQLEDTVAIMHRRFRDNSPVYCELAAANSHYMQAIAAATTADELVPILTAISRHGYLNWQVNEQALMETIGKCDLPLDQQKALLLESLDKNMLYVPLSEAGSDEFRMSPLDRALNSTFYGTGQA